MVSCSRLYKLGLYLQKIDQLHSKGKNQRSHSNRSYADQAPRPLSARALRHVEPGALINHRLNGYRHQPGDLKEIQRPYFALFQFGCRNGAFRHTRAAKRATSIDS